MRPIVLIALLAFVINSPYGVQAKSLFDLLETDKERCMRFAGVAEETMATVRGISVEEVCAEKADLAVKQREAERKARVEKARNQQIILLTAAVFIGTLVMVIVFRARRRIAAAFSTWLRQSKEVRAWVFGSLSWAAGTFLFVLLAEPYGSRMYDEEVLHMFGVMLIPPLFLGAVWFGYKRFVDIEATEVQPADYIAVPEDKDEEDHDQEEPRTDTIAAEVQRPVSTTSEPSLPVARGKGVTILIKVVGSLIALIVLFIVSAAISDITADRKFNYSLSMTLSIPFLIAIWHRSVTSKRVTAALVGSVAGIAVWGLGVAMLESGFSIDPFIISFVTSGSMLVSGFITLGICRRNLQVR